MALQLVVVVVACCCCCWACRLPTHVMLLTDTGESQARLPSQYVVDVV
jgi:hypothetical protein